MKNAVTDLDATMKTALDEARKHQPSLARAIECLDRAMGFCEHPNERRRLITVACNDLYELAVHDVMETLQTIEEKRRAR